MSRVFVACILLGLSPLAFGQNSAPSSHIVFDDEFDGDIIVNEVRVPKGGDAMYTYYEALGWRGKAAGYGGIQGHPKANLFIFSIWDHDSHSAPIRAVHRGGGTLTEGFGGEGTGLKSWNFKIGWSPDVWYTLVSRCWPMDDHTHFGYWRRDGESGRWLHLVTMDVATQEARFRGRTDAFIEDWLNTGQHARTTNLRGGWKRKMDGTWFPFASGRYSVNAWDLKPGKRSYNRRTNWDGGVRHDDTGPYYFMTAGGIDTKPSTVNPSTHKISRQKAKPGFTGAKIESASATRSGNRITVRWKIDPTTAPQFSYTISLSSKDNDDKPLHTVARPIPHRREQEFDLSNKAIVASHASVQVADIFGNVSNQVQVQISNEERQ